MPADDVRAAKAAKEAAIFARANVVGVAIGNKSIRGRETDERCIVVFVEAKRPEAELRRWDVVPKAFGGIRTDIVETGRFHALEMAQAVDLGRTRRIRPVPGGVSIGHIQITAGTLGVLARRNGRPVILSNNHVLANQNAGRVGDAVLEVDYGGPTAIFREQIVSDLLSKGGDSGSLVVDDARHAVGLLFAGGATTTLINPIAAVASALNVVIE